MAECASEIASSRGKKKRSYSMEFKKQVVIYAEANSNRSAASRFDVEPKRVREWKKDIDKINATKSKRQRLDGGGRKCIDADLEEDLVHWIYEKRSRMLHVSRKMIMWKAKSIFDEKNEDPALKDTFLASRGWCEKFMRRHGFSLRRKTTTAQKDPAYMVDRIVAYVMHVRRLQKQFSFHDTDTIAMDETPVWNDMVSNTTVEKTGSQEVNMKSTGHDKVRVSVCLAGKADGTRLKPFIVFKGAKRECKSLNEEFRGKCSVASSANGWMNEELTLQWCSEILGQFSFRKRLLAWDSYEAHLTDDVKKSLTKSKIESAIVPGGCAKYIQAPDVVWNKPFKGKIQEYYDDWLANGKHEYTNAGNMKPVPRRFIVDWVIKSWQAIPAETVAKPMKACGLSLAVDGTEDDLISCFKEGKKCAGGRAFLQAQMENLNDGSLHENPFDIVDEDVIAAAPAFNVIEEDDVDDDLDI